MDDSGYHLFTCKTGGRPVWSHESIHPPGQIVLQTAYPSLQGAEKQVHYYRQQTGHPLFDSDTGYNIDLDIALAHLWSSDIFPTSAGVDGASAERRADRKRAKYNKQQLPGGSIVRTIPLVMEHLEHGD